MTRVTNDIITITNQFIFENNFFIRIGILS